MMRTVETTYTYVIARLGARDDRQRHGSAQEEQEKQRDLRAVFHGSLLGWVGHPAGRKAPAMPVAK